MPCAGDDVEHHWQQDIYRVETHIPEWKSPNREIRAQAIDDFIKGLPKITKELLRPIAETLAMLDGNAFFGTAETEWYEQYLPEAYTLFHNNGGVTGWAGQMEHVRLRTAIEDNASAKELHDELQMVLILIGKDGSHKD